VPWCLGGFARAFAVLLAFGVTAFADTDPRLKTFAAQKRQQMQELAAKLHLDVPAEAREFFRAAEAGDWIAVSNSFERIRPATGTNGPLPGLRNVLYVPIHETFGAYAEFNDWDAAMLQKFTDGILRSIPAGSIYFGGTSSGRFIITTIRDVAKSPDIVVLTQNGLQDSSYMDYVRLVHGARIWLPSEKDFQQALSRYVEELPSAERKGVNWMMNLHGIMTKMIFENNKVQHEFYEEESHVLPWMYSYLEPHGLIMKMNKEPLTTLEPQVVTQDRQFWNALTKELLADRHFTGNEAARMRFSKLRSAIGGLYAYGHRMTNEAEVTFKQAVELCPTSPEPNYRLAQLYVETSRFDDAINLLQRYNQTEQREDDRQRTQQAITTIRDMQRQAAERKLQ
jgi:hypothetical protein